LRLRLFFALPRHETLNAMLDWSYSLLSEGRMQRRARQVRDRRLERVKAIVER
jgi:predicted ATPase